MEELIRISEHDGSGIGGETFCGEFLVSILNFLPRLVPEKVISMQKHTETDECFILLQGKAMIFLADGEDRPENISCRTLEPNKIYTVPKGVWHQPVMSEDAKILLVEKSNTVDANSPRLPLTDGQIADVRRLGAEFAH